MSDYSVLSKKNRLRLGIAVVVIIHIGFFYGFWHVKARQIGNKVVGLDIYGDTTTDGFSYYQALPDSNCLDVVHEQLAKPPMTLSAVSTTSTEPTSSEEDVVVAPLPIQPAHAPTCKQPSPLPEGYQKLGESGFVGLEVNIDKTGRIVRGEIDRRSGFPELDKAALKQVVETWAFEPCKKGDEAVACKQYIKFRWKEAK